MTTLRAFSLCDLFTFNQVNLDLLTETYNVSFYGKYLARWPEYCKVAENVSGDIQGYVLGKIEGAVNDEAKKNWHGHVTAVTVSPTSRRQGLASFLMKHLEDNTTKDSGYFVDLFVRCSNEVAIGMYEKLGYVIYRRIRNYYSGPEEDAFDMRKSMPKDPDKVTMQPLNKTIEPEELEFY